MTHVNLAALASVRDGTGHSVFSPSSSAMWLACSGSLIPNLIAPDDGNEDAAYGTVAHMVSEGWLKIGVRPDFLLGAVVRVDGFDITIDERMMHYASQSVERCRHLPGEHLVEVKADFSPLTPIPRQTGTLDHAAMFKRRGTVTDHKYGSAPDNIVYAKENSQLLFYVAGLFFGYDEWYDFEDFVLRVNQPRLDHFDEWHFTRAWLLDWMEWAKERAYLAWQPDAPRTPGVKQCKYCKVRGTCPALLKAGEDILSAIVPSDRAVTVVEMDRIKRNMADDIGEREMTVRDPVGLTTQQLVQLMPYRGMVERFFKAAEAELERRANYEKIPGMKTVEGKTYRVFKDVPKAAAHLRGLGLTDAEIFPKTIISPAQAEELLLTKGHRQKDMKALLEGVVFKPPGKPTLVPESDRRDALTDQSAHVWTTKAATPETDDL